MLRGLTEIHREYERILRSNQGDEQKDRELAELMTEMEGTFKIPGLRDEKFEKENRAVIALYRKLSKSRVTI